MKLISLLILTLSLSLAGCKAAEEDPLDNSNKKPEGGAVSEKADAIASRVYLEVKSMTAIAMTDELLTLRVSYSFNQGVVRTQQMAIPIKKGEARGVDVSNWLSGNNGTELMALIFRSRTVYENGDMFGFAFEVKKPFDGSQDRTSQYMVKAFVSEAGNRPSLQQLKSKFEFPAKSQLRTWLNE